MEYARYYNTRLLPPKLKESTTEENCFSIYIMFERHAIINNNKKLFFSKALHDFKVTTKNFLSHFILLCIFDFAFSKAVPHQEYHFSNVKTSPFLRKLLH